jgi:hypothetical protein
LTDQVSRPAIESALLRIAEFRHATGKTDHCQLHPGIVESPRETARRNEHKVGAPIHLVIQELEKLRRRVGVLVSHPIQRVITQAVCFELFPVPLPFLAQSRWHHDYDGAMCPLIDTITDATTAIAT